MRVSFRKSVILHREVSGNILFDHSIISQFIGGGAYRFLNFYLLNNIFEKGLYYIYVAGQELTK